MFDSIVRYPNGRTRAVKNLGWLLRNSAYVVSIVLRKLPQDGAYMLVLLTDNRTYQTNWGDYRLARKFCTRRRFGAAILTEQVSVIRENGYV